MGELISYSVQEDSMPLDPSNFSGGYGQLSVSQLHEDDELFLLETKTTITDGDRGTFSGVIQSVERSDETTTITANSLFSYFNGWFSIPPFSGLLSEYIQLLMDACDISVELVVEESLATKTVQAPGFEGNVWDNLRQLLSIVQVDFAQVADTFVLRPIRQFAAYDNKNTTSSTSIAMGTGAERVRVYWYDMEFGTDKEVSIQGLDNESVIQVDAGGTVVQEYTIDGSLSSVNQPVVKDYVSAGSNWDGTTGAYCVAGNDGLPIKAAQWTAQGGSLFVELTDNPSIIRVTVSGPLDDTYAPYRIAATSGSSNFYNTLRLTGDGFSWTKDSVLVYTGAPRSDSSAESDTEFDSPFVTSLASAYNVAARLSKTAVGARVESGTSRSLNSPQDRYSSSQASVSDFNDWADDNNVITIAQLNSTFTGATIGDWNSFWGEQMSNRFLNQAFGQAIGSRMKVDDMWFRVMSTTTGPDMVQFSMIEDTTIGDWNTWADEHGVTTIAQFNEWYNGYRFIDFNNTTAKR